WSPASLTAGGTRPRKFAHSDRLALPGGRAPPSRSRATSRASRGTRLPTRASEPAVVSMPSRVAMLSLTRTGIPWRGPRVRPARRWASRRAAIAGAAAAPPLGVTPGRDRRGVGVGLDDGVEDRVQALDPPEVGGGQLRAAEP